MIFTSCEVKSPLSPLFGSPLFQHWVVIFWCGALSPICNERVWKKGLRPVLSAWESGCPSFLETVVWDWWVRILHPLSPSLKASTTSTSTSHHKSTPSVMPRGPWMPRCSCMPGGEWLPRCPSMPRVQSMPRDLSMPRSPSMPRVSFPRMTIFPLLQLLFPSQTGKLWNQSLGLSYIYADDTNCGTVHGDKGTKNIQLYVWFATYKSTVIEIVVTWLDFCWPHLSHLADL